MNQKNLITVIVPVYNCEKYLSRCLDSIVAQTYPALEILLIDDGSKDSSGAICDCYATQDARIKVFHIENGGVSNARNLGLDNATGDYVAFVDSDDYIEPDMYEKLLNKAIRSDADMVFCNYSSFNEDRVIPIVERDLEGFVRNRDYIRLISGLAETRIMGSIWRILFKGEFVAKFRFDTSVIMGEDNLLIWEAMADAKRLDCVSEPLYHYYYQSKTNYLKYVDNEKYFISQQRLTETINSILERMQQHSLVCSRKWETYVATVKMLMRCDNWAQRIGKMKKEPFWSKLNTRENYAAYKKVRSNPRLISKVGDFLVRYNLLWLYHCLLRIRWRNLG